MFADNPTRRQAAAVRQASVDVRNLSWGPRGQGAILADASFSVDAGETLAIVGPNGAGKTTLLRCLYRYHRPRSGRVCVDGEDIWAMSARTCARKIATVLQDQPGEFSLTVREVVGLGRIPYRQGFSAVGAEDEAVVEAALARMALEDFANRHLSSLSGGERQRVMVARAIAQEPALIILDEPTNNLDIRHQLELLTMMRGLGPTVVVSLHDLNLASAHADRILVLNGGRVLEVGSPAEVLTAARVREAFEVETIIDTEPVTGAARFSFHLFNAS